MLGRIAILAALAKAQGALDQIEHIVVFMQENRAFDHYYGSLQGVRGFNDRSIHPLKSGLPVFYQPSDLFNASAYMLPFHVSTLSTSAICMDAPTMNYPTDILIWNGGRMDGWNTARVAGMGMSFFNRTDLPFYYTLADSFLVGDHYHQSTFTCTDPNRMHLFAGGNGLSSGFPAVLDNTEPSAGYTWETMGETLQNAGITWKVLQEEDNFDDNGLAWFKPFKNIKAGNPLFDNGLAIVPDLVAGFDELLSSSSMPQVTYIVGPAALSEHATYHPCAGEDLSARLLARLAAHPDIYAKTVFILDYDEGGQFVDHVWPPTPPMGAGDGVSSVTSDGEINLGLPIGPAFRVPLMVISPWTRGNIVSSQVFDHTSVVQLIEKKFGVKCPNISPWRRMVTGDMTSVFNWDTPDYTWPVLPNTSNYVQQGNEECSTLPPPTLPAEQSYPTQEPGVRISRALPYQFNTSDTVNSTTFSLGLTNTGTAGAPFLGFDLTNLEKVSPRKYGAAAASSVSDTWSIDASSSVYFFALHGANGFVRLFSGDVSAQGSLSLSLSAVHLYSPSDSTVSILLSSAPTATVSVTFTITDNAYGLGGPWTYNVAPGKSVVTAPFNVSSIGNWYDFSVDAQPSPAQAISAPTPLLFHRRYMGRMETGADTISDPAMAAGVPGYVPIPHAAKSEAEWVQAVRAFTRLGGRMDASLAFQPSLGRSTASGPAEHTVAHPPLPNEYRFFPRVQGDHKDSQYTWLPAHFEEGA